MEGSKLPFISVGLLQLVLKLFCIFRLVMVLMCLALSVFSTMPDFEEQATVVLFYIEIIFVNWLAIEYVARVWSAGCRSRYRGLAGRVRFATSAYCIIGRLHVYFGQ